MCTYALGSKLRRKAFDLLNFEWKIFVGIGDKYLKKGVVKTNRRRKRPESAGGQNGASEQSRHSERDETTAKHAQNFSVSCKMY